MFDPYLFISWCDVMSLTQTPLTHAKSDGVLSTLHRNFNLISFVFSDINFHWSEMIIIEIPSVFQNRLIPICGSD